jgi:hypothetical protein
MDKTEERLMEDHTVTSNEVDIHYRTGFFQAPPIECHRSQSWRRPFRSHSSDQGPRARQEFWRAVCLFGVSLCCRFFIEKV